MNPAQSQQANKAINAARASIYSNTALVVMKLLVGVYIGSVSVISEAIHSASDLAASFIAFFSVRASRKPADEGHPYGHGKIESLSGIIEALLIFGAAAYIIYESIMKLFFHRGELLKPGLGFIVMLVSAVVNLFVSRYLYRVSREADSLALEADAAHLSADVYTSAGVTVGLGLAWITGYHFIDPFVAICVALFICWTAFKLTRDSLKPLLDATLPANEIAAIDTLFEKDERVYSYHKLRSRKSGNIRHIDVHIQIDDNLTFVEAHDITEELEDRIRDLLPNVEITIHSEPYSIEIKHQQEAHGLEIPRTESHADNDEPPSHLSGV